MTGQDNPLLAYGAWLADAPDAWPDAALEAARNAFIDTIGVAIPGAAEPVTRKVLAAVRGWGDGRCTVIGSDLRLAAPASMPMSPVCRSWAASARA